MTIWSTLFIEDIVQTVLDLNWFSGSASGITLFAVASLASHVTGFDTIGSKIGAEDDNKVLGSRQIIIVAHILSKNRDRNDRVPIFGA